RFKWGVPATSIRSRQTSNDAAGKFDEGLDAHTWDDDFEDLASDQPVAPYIIPISDADRAILRQHFADPVRWNKLSDRAKAVYSRELDLNEQEIERHADH
ncbi:MAG: hypothetical protein P8Y67_15030, partial [Alphaproteobacteria bacterium]